MNGNYLGKYVHVYMFIQHAGLICTVTVHIKSSTKMFFYYILIYIGGDEMLPF